MPIRLLLAALVVAMLPSTAAAQARGGATCDRQCLVTAAEQYLDALAAKDLKRIQVAPTVRYTENGQRLRLGDGLWNSASGRGTYKLHVADTTLGQVVTFTTMREAGTPILLAVRLKVENKVFSEIEAQVARSENAAKNLEATGKPREAFSRPTPPADRMSRAELVRVANMYFSGMQLNDGKGTYPFADDCDRLENGGRIRRRQATTPRCGPAASSSNPGCCTSSVAFATAATWRWTRSTGWSWRSPSSITTPVRRAHSRRRTAAP